MKTRQNFTKEQLKEHHFTVTVNRSSLAGGLTAKSRIFHEMCINKYLLLLNELPSVAYHMKGLKELNILEQVAMQSVEA